jgi:hypothetical protein
MNFGRRWTLAVQAGIENLGEYLRASGAGQSLGAGPQSDDRARKVKSR